MNATPTTAAGRRRRHAAVSSIGTTAMVALALGAHAQVADAFTQVPFNASYVGTFTPTSAGFTVTGTGHATELGASTNQGTVVMQPQSNPTCPSTGFVVTNEEVLTAANGDQLNLSILDLPCPVPGEPGIYDGVAAYRVTGGTGRFAGANGSGTFDGRGNFTNPNNLTFTYTIKGTVSTTKNR